MFPTAATYVYSREFEFKVTPTNKGRSIYLGLLLSLSNICVFNKVLIKLKQIFFFYYYILSTFFSLHPVFYLKRLLNFCNVEYCALNVRRLETITQKSNVWERMCARYQYIKILTKKIEASWLELLWGEEIQELNFNKLVMCIYAYYLIVFF